MHKYKIKKKFILDNSIQFFVLKRFPFGWSDELFNQYLIFKYSLTAIGVTLFPIFLNCFNCVGKESLMVASAILANSLSVLILGVTESSFVVFLGKIFNMFF